VPVPDRDAEVNPIRLEGPVPSAANPPSGCVFQTRCPRKIGALCEQQAPPAQIGNAGHTVMCHIPLATLVRSQSLPSSSGRANIASQLTRRKE
jgi:peptide/nickel transport system ATP-binding protein